MATITTMNGDEPSTGLCALRRLKTIEPPQFLAHSSELSRETRETLQYLFSSLKDFGIKSQLDQLLVDGFDAEQIYQQIELQSQPLMTLLRREVKHFETNPHEILKIFGEKKVGLGDKKNAKIIPDVLDEDEDMEDFDEEEDEEEDEAGESEEEDADENIDGSGIEDRFLKLNELEEYLENDEAKEYGLKPTSKNKKNKKSDKNAENESEEEDDDDEEEENEEFGLDDDESEAGENYRYEDFFGGKKKKDVKRTSELIDGSEDSDTGDEEEDVKEDVKEDTEVPKSQNDGTLSTHEKELIKLRSEVEKMEQENIAHKNWTMQGEITAAKRPMNSALAAGLDFEQNMRPAPVITEEVTASIEDLIMKRILEGRFDDVQKPSGLLSKAPKEQKELDENKSKKGLAEIYEDEYAQKVNPDSAPLTFSDERKKEASLLFKHLCLKLDALSHFNFAPKPVIHDMSIQVNVPALAMEEVAPMAVSDAAMLAPEEVFGGKGDIKEDTELTQAERKKRRANKKRKFKSKSEKKMAEKRVRENTILIGKEPVS